MPQANSMISVIPAGSVTPSSLFNTRITTPIRQGTVSSINRMLLPPPPRSMNRPSIWGA